MDDERELDLGLPSPLRPFEVTAVAERPEGEEPPGPAAWPSVVEVAHLAALSRWRLSMLAPSASVALSVAETLLPEACGATWTVRPAAAGQPIG